MTMRLEIPCAKKDIRALKTGDPVYLSGTVYTARDCAHRRLRELIDGGAPLPFEIKDAFIYYAGPCPAPPGAASGSCGPTTSARMEGYAPLLLDMGLGGMIGKGEMNEETREAIRRNGCVYFAAVGGAGALYGSRIRKSELIAFPELLSEAVYRLEIEDFPVIVAIDGDGETIYR